MDDLLAYLRHEIAMDGDDGTTSYRLDAFVQAFYEQRAASEPSSSSVTSQNVDASFREFVWKQLVSLPEVKVACLRKLEAAPQLALASVLADERGESVDGQEGVEQIPIQDQGKFNLKNKSKIKAARKDKGKHGRDARLTGESWEFCELAIDEVEESSRQQLVERYGLETLRVAVDPETSFMALTGSHERKSKLTHLSYQVLQAIARGRESGKTVIELGQEFDHDQKSLFHFVRNLVEMGFIVKIKVLASRAQTSRCIHRHYLESSPHWATWMTRDPDITGKKDNDDEEEEDTRPTQLSILTTTHLNSNEPLVRSRILHALRRAPDHTIIHANLVFAIGFQSRPDQMNRRRLNRIITNMVAQNLVEKVGVEREGSRALLGCIRLTEFGLEHQPRNQVGDLVEMDEQRPNILRTLPVERQIMDLLVQAGSRGATISDLRAGLGDLNKRIIETILVRYEKNPEPPHLCDFRIQSVLETEGREKRLRWFTVSGYHERCRLDGLSDLYDPEDFSHPELAGGFSALETTGFYKDAQAFNKYARSTHTGGKEQQARRESRAKASKSKGKRGPKAAAVKPVKKTKHQRRIEAMEKAVAAGEATQEELDKLRAEPPRQRGRPRKEPKEPTAEGETTGEPKPKAPRKRKAAEVVEVVDGVEGQAANPEQPPAKRRRAPRKDKKAEQTKLTDAENAGETGEVQAQNAEGATPDITNASEVVKPPSRKRKSRAKPKEPPVSAADAPADGEVPPTTGEAANADSQAEEPQPKKKKKTKRDQQEPGPNGTPPPPPIRGRPRKYPPGTTAVERKRMLEERRLAGLEPMISKLAQTKAARAAAAAAAAAGSEPIEGDISATSTPAATPSVVDRPKRNATRKQSSIPSEDVVTDGQDHNISVDASGEDTGLTPESPESKGPIEVVSADGSQAQQTVHEQATTGQHLPPALIDGAIVLAAEAAPESAHSVLDLPMSEDIPVNASALFEEDEEEAVEPGATSFHQSIFPTLPPFEAFPSQSGVALSEQEHTETAQIIPTRATAIDDLSSVMDDIAKAIAANDISQAALGGSQAASPALPATPAQQPAGPPTTLNEVAHQEQNETLPITASGETASPSANDMALAQSNADTLPEIEPPAVTLEAAHPEAAPPSETKAPNEGVNVDATVVAIQATDTIPALWSPEQAARLAASLPNAFSLPVDNAPPSLNDNMQASSLGSSDLLDLSTMTGNAYNVLPPMPPSTAILEPQITEAQLAALPAMPVAVKKQLKAAKPTRKAGSRNKPAKAERINYSIHTHENEYHKVLQEQGGVIDSKAYEKAWQQWMLRKNGVEPYQLDRRTLSTVWNGLEKRGLVKRTTIQIEGTAGKLLQKPIFLLAELELNSPAVTDFIAKLQEQEIAAAKNWLVGRKKVTDSGKFKHAKSRPRPKRTEGISPAVDPRAFFALEWEAVAQSYGWYYGIFARARALHRFLVDSVSDDNDSPYIISSSDTSRIFATPFVLFECPLSVFLHISAFQQFSDDLDALLSQQDSTKIAIKDVPPSITSCFRQTKGRPNLRFAPLFEIMSYLGLVQPLEPVELSTDIVAFSGPEREPRYFQQRASKGASYWKLADESPIYDAFASDPEARRLLGALPVATAEQVNHYWDVLQKVHTDASDLPTLSPPAHPYPELFEAGDVKDFAGRGSSRWKDEYFLLRSQKSYIRRVMGEREERSSLLDDAEALGQLAFNVCAPVDTVREYIEKQLKEGIDAITPKRKSVRRERIKAAAKDSGHSESSESEASPQAAPKPRKASKQRGSIVDQASPAPAAEDPTAILARKAKDNRKQKLSIFNAIIERFAAEHGQQSVPTDQLGFLQEWFVSPNGLTADGLRSHLETEVGVMPILPTPVTLTGRTLDTRSRTLKSKSKATKMKRMPKVKSERPSLNKRKEAMAQDEHDEDEGPLPADSEDESEAEQQFVLPPLPPVEISNEKKTAANGWNDAEDEQLRDFYVILHSRAAHLGCKFNIDPAKRYYPGCTGKLLLDRLRRYVSHHGDGPYFDALQQAWSEIWLKRRGKARLPDPHPKEYGNFDLHAHRSYLCAKINKQSIRFQAMMPNKASDETSLLPYDVDDLEETYNIPTKETLSLIHSPNAYDYLWSTITAAQKAKEYNHRSFLLNYTEDEDLAEAMTSSDRVQYFAKKFLYAKTLEDTVYQTAAAFEKRLATDKEHEWSLLAEDGDMLAITTMFSDNLLDFKFDTSVTLEGRPYTDYRTRKIDDESFENAVTITINQAYKDLKKPVFADAGHQAVLVDV